MNKIVEARLSKDGRRLAVAYCDGDTESPREWSNTGTIVCWNGKDHLGDEKHGGDKNEFIKNLDDSWDDDEEVFEEAYRLLKEVGSDATDAIIELQYRWRSARHDAIIGRIVALPLCVYEHSGRSIKINRSGREDGWIYCTEKRAVEEYKSYRDFHYRIATGPMSWHSILPFNANGPLDKKEVIAAIDLFRIEYRLKARNIEQWQADSWIGDIAKEFPDEPKDALLDRLRKLYDNGFLTLRDVVEERLKAEIETYNQYLTGDVYYVCVFNVSGHDVDISCYNGRVVIDIKNAERDKIYLEDLEDLNSCGDFYGLDYAFEAMLEEGGENE